MSAQQDDEVNVDVHVASDWPKDLEGRSLSGGMMIINGITGGTLDKDASAENVSPRQERNTTRNARHIFQHTRTQSARSVAQELQSSCTFQALCVLKEACCRSQSGPHQPLALVVLHYMTPVTFITEHTSDDVHSKGLTMLLRLGKRSVPQVS